MAISRLRIAAALGAVVAATLAAAWLWPSAASGPLSASPPRDDFDWLGSPSSSEGDAAEHSSAGSVLVAGPSALYLARAGERSIVELPKTGKAEKRVIAHFEGSVRAMAWADGALWVATATDDRLQPAGALLRVPTSGEGGEAPRSVASGLADIRSVACDGKGLFVAEVDAAPTGLLRATTIERWPTGGGERRPLGHADGEVDRLVLDADNVYWADSLEGTIVAVARGGGTARVLASERGLPSSLTRFDDALVWVERRSEALFTMPLRGGVPKRLTQDFAGFAHLVAGQGALWWVNEAAVDGGFRVLRVDAAGGDVSVETRTVAAIDDLATDGARVFWSVEGRAGAVRE